MNWLRHAFAIRAENAGPLRLEEQELVEWFCGAVVRRRLAPVVLAALELARPLSGLVAQGLYFFTPILSVLVCREQVDRLACFFQRPEAVDILCQRLESLEAASTGAKTAEVSRPTEEPCPPSSEAGGFRQDQVSLQMNPDGQDLGVF
jgi:hypothetical protein